MLRSIGMLAGISIATILLGSAAQATTYTVEAIVDQPNWLDTGIDASASTTYDFSVVNPATIWSAGAETPYSRDSTANGIDPSFYGLWTQGGATFNYGALVGEDATHYFLIGAGPTILSGLSGEVRVGYWDSNYGDNTGTQTLSITSAASAPEASTWAMLLAGFSGLGFAAFGRGRKVKTARIIA